MAVGSTDSTLVVGSTLIITRNRFGHGKIICSGLAAQDIIKPGCLKWQS